MTLAYTDAQINAITADAVAAIMEFENHNVLINNFLTEGNTAEIGLPNGESIPSLRNIIRQIFMASGLDAHQFAMEVYYKSLVSGDEIALPTEVEVMQGERVASRDFNFDPVSINATGGFTDGTIAWIVDTGRGKTYAYNLADGARVANRDFNFDPANTAEAGGFTDGTIAWIIDGIDDKTYAYNLADGARVASRDFNFEPVNNNGQGGFTDGTIAWIVDSIDDKTYAYNLADGTRVASRDFNFDPANTAETGGFTDGTIAWIVDGSDNKTYAYNLADGARVASRDFNFDPANTAETGGFTDGTIAWIVDSTDRKTYAQYIFNGFILNLNGWTPTPPTNIPENQKLNFTITFKNKTTGRRADFSPPIELSVATNGNNNGGGTAGATEAVVYYTRQATTPTNLPTIANEALTANGWTTTAPAGNDALYAVIVLKTGDTYYDVSNIINLGNGSGSSSGTGADTNDLDALAYYRASATVPTEVPELIHLPDISFSVTKEDGNDLTFSRNNSGAIALGDLVWLVAFQQAGARAYRVASPGTATRVSSLDIPISNNRYVGGFTVESQRLMWILVVNSAFTQTVANAYRVAENGTATREASLDITIPSLAVGGASRDNVLYFVGADGSLTIYRIADDGTATRDEGLDLAGFTNNVQGGVAVGNRILIVRRTEAFNDLQFLTVRIREDGTPVRDADNDSAIMQGDGQGMFVIGDYAYMIVGNAGIAFRAIPEQADREQFNTNGWSLTRPTSVPDGQDVYLSIGLTNPDTEKYTDFTQPIRLGSNAGGGLTNEQVAQIASAYNRTRAISDSEGVVFTPVPATEGAVALIANSSPLTTARITAATYNPSNISSGTYFIALRVAATDETPPDKLRAVLFRQGEQATDFITPMLVLIHTTANYKYYAAGVAADSHIIHTIPPALAPETQTRAEKGIETTTNSITAAMDYEAGAIMKLRQLLDIQNPSPVATNPLSGDDRAKLDALKLVDHYESSNEVGFIVASAGQTDLATDGTYTAIPADPQFILVQTAQANNGRFIVNARVTAGSSTGETMITLSPTNIVRTEQRNINGQQLAFSFYEFDFTGLAEIKVDYQFPINKELKVQQDVAKILASFGTNTIADIMALIRANAPTPALRELMNHLSHSYRTGTTYEQTALATELNLTINAMPIIADNSTSQTTGAWTSERFVELDEITQEGVALTANNLPLILVDFARGVINTIQKAAATIPLTRYLHLPNHVEDEETFDLGTAEHQDLASGYTWTRNLPTSSDGENGVVELNIQIKFIGNGNVEDIQNLTLIIGGAQQTYIDHNYQEGQTNIELQFDWIPTGSGRGVRMRVIPRTLNGLDVWVIAVSMSYQTTAPNPQQFYQRTIGLYEGGGKAKFKLENINGKIQITGGQSKVNTNFSPTEFFPSANSTIVLQNGVGYRAVGITSGSVTDEEAKGLINNGLAYFGLLESEDHNDVEFTIDNARLKVANDSGETATLPDNDDKLHMRQFSTADAELSANIVSSTTRELVLTIPADIELAKITDVRVVIHDGTQIFRANPETIPLFGLLNEGETNYFVGGGIQIYVEFTSANRTLRIQERNSHQFSERQGHNFLYLLYTK